MNSSSSANAMISSKRSRASRAGEAEHDRVDDHVVARGEIGVEADAELDERRQPAADLDPAGVDVVDPGEALQQRALAAAVAPDDAEELALAISSETSSTARVRRMWAAERDVAPAP